MPEYIRSEVAEVDGLVCEALAEAGEIALFDIFAWTIRAEFDNAPELRIFNIGHAWKEDTLAVAEDNEP